jgi:hypothetical protein
MVYTPFAPSFTHVSKQKLCIKLSSLPEPLVLPYEDKTPRNLLILHESVHTLQRGMYSTSYVQTNAACFWF